MPCIIYHWFMPAHYRNNAVTGTRFSITTSLICRVWIWLGLWPTESFLQFQQGISSTMRLIIWNGQQQQPQQFNTEREKCWQDPPIYKETVYAKVHSSAEYWFEENQLGLFCAFVSPVQIFFTTQSFHKQFFPLVNVSTSFIIPLFLCVLSNSVIEFLLISILCMTVENLWEENHNKGSSGVLKLKLNYSTGYYTFKTYKQETQLWCSSSKILTVETADNTCATLIQ